MNEETTVRFRFWWPWVVFAFIWLVLVPKVLNYDANLFEIGWWLNEVGHATFGFLWIYSALVIAKYKNMLLVPRALAKHAVRHPIISCMTVAILWEFCEFALWDNFGYLFFPEFGLAQKGAVDTVLDIASATVLALITYCRYQDCSITCPQMWFRAIAVPIEKD